MKDPHFTAKAHMYKTAQALIGCAKFTAGTFVSISHYWTDENGTDWFYCNTRKDGDPMESACYPAHHLTAFCL